jgi:hypothetical protein
MGVKFRELSIALVVSRQEDGASQDGFYLVAAFNTSRLFTWSERLIFQTPYQRARVEVGLEPPTFELNEGLQTVARAALSARGPAESREELWEGAIFLPGRDSGRVAGKPAPAEPGKVFYARHGGLTEVFPFAPDMDVLQINPSLRQPAWQWLLDSRFTGREWRIRRQAAHARSKTFRRPPATQS